MEITGRNLGIWQISQDKNVSDQVPLKMRFYLPPTANGLRNMPLSYSITDFETYTGITEAAGDHSHEIEIPPHAHNFALWNHSDANSNDEYALAVQDIGGVWSLVTNQAVGASAMTSEAGGSTNTTSYASEKHTHNIIAQLGTSAYACDYVTIKVDGVDITTDLESDYGSLPIPDAMDLDIYEYLSDPVLNAWHEVLITPKMYDTEQSAMCYMYAYLSPEMTGAGI